MKLRSNKDMLDIRTALWLSFLAFILQVKNPDLLDVIIQWIGRQ
jgi:hypothetical protein